MRDPRDNQTAELLPVPAKRGRPATGTAMSGAERMRLQRARDAARREDEAQRRDEALRMLCNAATPNPEKSSFGAGYCYGVGCALAKLGIITYDVAERALDWHNAARRQHDGD